MREFINPNPDVHPRDWDYPCWCWFQPDIESLDVICVLAHSYSPHQSLIRTRIAIDGYPTLHHYFAERFKPLTPEELDANPELLI